jgi:hypothetical protein
MSRRVVVYDEIRVWHTPGLVLRKMLGMEIFTLRIPAPSKTGRLLRHLLTQEWVKVLRLREWPYRAYNPSIALSFEATERELEARSPYAPMIDSLTDLYGDQRVIIAFKKACSESLQRSLEFALWCTSIERELGMETSWRYVPSCPERAWHESLLDRNHLHLRSHLTRGSRILGQIRRIWSTILNIGLCVVSVTIAGWRQIRRRESFSRGQCVPFCIAIVSPLREFTYAVKGIDFLLDGERITKDNTVFAEHRAEMGRRGLRLAQSCPLPSWTLWRKAAAVALKTIGFAVIYPRWASRAAALLIREYLVWSSFVSAWKTRHFVSYADYSVRHIGRNLILSKNGTQTWYYADAEFTYETMPGPMHLDLGFGYLCFDHCVTWSHRYARYMQSHHQAIPDYRVVGSYWSEQVLAIRDGRIKSVFAQNLPERVPRGAKVIAVFDAFYHNDGWLPIRYGVLFARAMTDLLNERPDVFMVFKEKKWPAFYTSADSDELKSAYQALASHPRCLVPGFEVSTPEVLAVSELCVSFPFGSPTMEAVGAGIKAIYYAPDKQYMGGYYDRVPGLVVYDQTSLLQRVGELLDQTSNADFQEYLRTYVKGDIDPYLDGFGLTRFRNLLSETP